VNVRTGKVRLTSGGRSRLGKCYLASRTPAASIASRQLPNVQRIARAQSRFSRQTTVHFGLLPAAWLLKPEDHRLAVQVLGPPTRDVGQVDPAGRQRLAPRTEVLKDGVVEHPVATSARRGPQVVFANCETSIWRLF